MKVVYVAALAFLMSTSASFALSLDFTIVNNTNSSIEAMWGSSIDSPRYIRIPMNTVVPRRGGTMFVYYDQGATGRRCWHDLKLRFSTGRVVTMDQVNLCSFRYLHIDSDGDGVISYRRMN
jgi:hypothetical protein